MAKGGIAAFQLESLNFDIVNCLKTEEINNTYLLQTEDFILRQKEEIFNLIKNIEKDYDNRIEIGLKVESLLQRQNSLSEKQKVLQSLLEKKKTEKENYHQRNEIRKNILSLYEKYLALKIKPVHSDLKTEGNGCEHSLLFSFHNINKNRPQDCCTFQLTTDGITYKVSSCTPAIDDLEILLGDLNKTNDLSTFIVKVRKSFCSLHLK